MALTPRYREEFADAITMFIRDKVRDALENLKGVVGTAGVFNFSPQDHNGLTLDAFEMLTVKDGKFAIYRN